MRRHFAATAFLLAALSLTSCGTTDSSVADLNELPQEGQPSSDSRAVPHEPNLTSGEHGQGGAEFGSDHRHDAVHLHHGAQHESSAHGIHDDSKTIAIGDTVPDFEVSIAGKKWKLSELRQNKEITADGTLVLTFWCSFCHSCRHVEKSLDALAQEYRGQVGVIALDASAGESTEGVAEFALARELSLPIALDASGASADIFGTRVTTTTVVIDKDGLLRYRGQFGDGQHSFALDALHAVLAGKDVPVQETRQKG